ncbi:MAG: helix-turn-helix transcriptional regulator [Candidatus Thermoplasmatota archaeon]|nr:helix-turn-helix transcriptional regulator [Candidatus Thermoplasmatota archaeon]
MTGKSNDARVKNRNKACMIEYGESVVCVDPSLSILDLIGKKYTMMIIGVIGNSGDRKNFNEILNDIPFSSSTIISRRLKDLQRSGLVEKTNGTGRISYRLTKLGWSVREALHPLLRQMETGP